MLSDNTGSTWIEWEQEDRGFPFLFSTSSMMDHMWARTMELPPFTTHLEHPFFSILIYQMKLLSWKTGDRQWGHWGQQPGGLSLMGSVCPVTCNLHFLLHIAIVRGYCPPTCKWRNQALERLGNQPKVMETELESRPSWFPGQCSTRPGRIRHWAFASVHKTGMSNSQASRLPSSPPGTTSSKSGTQQGPSIGIKTV